MRSWVSGFGRISLYNGTTQAICEDSRRDDQSAVHRRYSPEKVWKRHRTHHDYRSTRTKRFGENRTFQYTGDIAR